MLADRPEGYQPKNRPPFKSLVPLNEIIAESLGRGVNTKGVKIEYDSIIKQGGNDFNILLNLSRKELEKITLPKIAEGIIRVRSGKLIIKPGYDGEYGVVKIFTKEEQKKSADGQSSLF